MSIVFYEGPSELDGSTIIRAYLTGYERPSANVKTGPMVQTWIMKADRPPYAAVLDGTDAAVCGSCIHRGDGFKNRSCYVNVLQGPTRAYENVLAFTTVEEAARLCAWKVVRLGAYGNPSAVPYDVWESLLAHTKGWTGYEHEWRTCDPRFKRLCMASVESEADAEEARKRGWRTYRVVADTNQIHKRNEILCPASDEAGRRTTCLECRLCNGTGSSAKSVAVPVHGIQPIKAAFLAKQPQVALA